MRAIVFLFFPLFFSIAADAQTLSRTIDWQDNGSNLWFREAEYPNPKVMDPHYFELIPIAPNTSDVQLNILNAQWQPLSKAEVALLKNTASIGVKPHTYNIATENKRNYVALSIPTIRRDSANMLEKLISFDIEIIANKTATTDQGSRSKDITATSSVLSNGKWVKINVDKSGVYKITYSQLMSWGFQDAKNVSVWGNGGVALPYMNNVSCYDDLNAIPIYLEKGEDGIFNANDYILFYAEGPSTYFYEKTPGIWTIKQHPYSTTASYFITTDSPQKLIGVATEPTGAYTHSSQSYDGVEVFESNDTNLVKSGRNWFGDMFDIITSRNYNTSLNNPIAGSPVKVWVRVAAKSPYSTNFSVGLNSTPIGSIHLNGISGDSYSDVVSEKGVLLSGSTPDNNITISLTYNKATTADVAWLDFIAVNARQQLKCGNSQLTFWDSQTVGHGNITQFTLLNTPPKVRVWDISNLHNTLAIPTSGAGSMVFKQTTDTLRRFIAFTPENVYTVNSASDVAPQNIHGTGHLDMVIVTHPDYLPHSNAIADIHRIKDNISVGVFTTEQVYNEFSSGNADVSAIRNLMRMLYKRAQHDSERPKYLLLFGDGSYNNISNSTRNTNRIPTYQSSNSINAVDSFVSDDFFGLLDDNEGEAIGLLDIGIGRIPSSTIAQADVALNKIKKYTSTNNISDWQSMLCFAGDDEDGNIHMEQANNLADYVRKHHSEYNVQKILFDAYPQVVLSTGQSYPAVTEAINSRMNNGALIFNYTGHANERWMANEKVIMLNDILSWQNINALTLFITATCEFSRFDDPNLISAGEHVLFAPKGGAVSLLSTTRVVYSSPNYTLNYNFMNKVFEKDNNSYYALGDLVRISKNNSGSGYNKRNFTLLGDPALKLRYPTYKMEVLTINNTPIDEPLDTLKALSPVIITGRVCDNDGSTVNTFNGKATISLYDKITAITTLANDGGMPMTFQSQENVLFKGNSTVTNGQFRIEFIVPKDINFAYGKGKISMFATNDEISCMGTFSNVMVGGINPSTSADTDGPQITLYLNNKYFKDGGICDANPKLIVELRDESGINTTGIGIGHNFTAKLSDIYGITTTINLNNYYVSNTDNYRQGMAEYQFSNLTAGKKKITVKVWDAHNNSSEAEISFIVTNGNELITKNFYCYPNPVVNGTSFFFEHNQPNSALNIEIQIYSISGGLVSRIRIDNAQGGDYRYGPIEWDGCGQQGSPLSRGVYICRLQVTTADGQKSVQQHKLVVYR